MTKEFISPLMLLRTKVGLTQQDLAEILGVSRTTVARWEQGLAQPALNLVQMKALCSALKVSVEELPDSFGPQPIENHTIGPASGFQS